MFNQQDSEFHFEEHDSLAAAAAGRLQRLVSIREAALTSRCYKTSDVTAPQGRATTGQPTRPRVSLSQWETMRVRSGQTVTQEEPIDKPG